MVCVLKLPHHSILFTTSKLSTMFSSTSAKSTPTNTPSKKQAKNNNCSHGMKTTSTNIKELSPTEETLDTTYTPSSPTIQIVNNDSTKQQTSQINIQQLECLTDQAKNLLGSITVAPFEPKKWLTTANKRLIEEYKQSLTNDGYGDSDCSDDIGTETADSIDPRQLIYYSHFVKYFFKTSCCRMEIRLAIFQHLVRDFESNSAFPLELQQVCATHQAISCFKEDLASAALSYIILSM